MVVLDAEKAELAATYGDLPPPATTKDSVPKPNRRARRLFRTRRLRKAAVYSAAVVLLLLGLRTLTHLDPFTEGVGLWTSTYRSATDHRPLTLEDREKLFLSIPSAGSALAASRDYATHPHLAGSAEDFSDAKAILQLFQDEFNIHAPRAPPIFPAGTTRSREATLRLTRKHTLLKPSAWIDVYYPVLNTPLNRSLEILSSENIPVWTADLVEDGDPLDEDAHRYKDAVPTWHGLSRDGIAEGQLVYANYGTKEDYDELVASGANLTGKIVIARYGGIFRGLKIKRAEELGAVGVLIYSDPRDDGYVTVQNGYTPYPAGPARNPTSVQRGSVQYLSIYPGDPTTPGYPAYENAERTEGTNIPNIPSLPISWSNAERLLEEIGEIYTTRSGKRRLSGRSSVTSIKLVNHVDTKVTPIWNTMAAIPGHIRDEVVIIGCHRDAWVAGAADPTSGTVSLHEIIRGFGALLRKGWKPLRTIVIASWDAEEYGLVGSTEWGEDFSDWISDHVVAYLNVDVSVAGSQWNVGGSPSLAHIIKQTALDVPHPTIPGKTLWDARNDQGPFHGITPYVQNTTVDEEFMASYQVAQEAKNSLQTGVSPLGSGSDYTVFLQRLGVASTDQGFSFTPSDAVYHYHSIYDSQRWQEVYADVGFHKHVAVAQHLGLLALRIIDSIVIPLNTTQYAFELSDYLAKVQNLVPHGTSIDFSPLETSIYKLQNASLALDAEKTTAETKFKELLGKLPRRPHLGECKHHGGTWNSFTRWVKGVFGVETLDEPFRSMHAGSVHDSEREQYLAYIVNGEEEELEALLSQAIAHQDTQSRDYIPFPIGKFIKAAKRVARANKKLVAFERGFISEEGIPEREWYRHLGVAPGKWLGYGATTFPALTEAITIDNSTSAAHYQVYRLTMLLDRLTWDLRL
ncbi:Zn-dependent exopeptidase [Pluteus cervinus]|uniref:Zn-dependent exopeptidase n=1 Tax=Pluteus cervinus TaxID=181527 RepID=A0ACD3B0Y2_9AGAR|nr:Zn-dependent exopeptidase [Pluteus cervinus]